jgi:hypothetical protein
VRTTFDLVLVIELVPVVGLRFAGTAVQTVEVWNGEKDINTPLLLLKKHLHNDAWE